MFLLVEGKTLNLKRVTTIKFNKEALAIYYHFNDGGIEIEKFKDEIEANQKFEEIIDSNLFFKTNDLRLVNFIYIKNIEKDLFNSKKLVYEMYSAAPIKETLASEKEVDEKIQNLQQELESKSPSSDDGDIDLSNYYNKTQCDEKYATNVALDSKISDITNQVDELVGDIESLLGGI